MDEFSFSDLVMHKLRLRTGVHCLHTDIYVSVADFLSIFRYLKMEIEQVLKDEIRTPKAEKQPASETLYTYVQTVGNFERKFSHATTRPLPQNFRTTYCINVRHFHTVL
jgi:hypothetical protein